jgi:hypothetical protein
MFNEQQAYFMLGGVARLAMATIFAAAAVHSMRDWPSYTAIVVNYRILKRPFALMAAWLLPPLQLVAAILLVAGASAGALLGLALMAVFIAAVAINVARGRVGIDCGCGGAAGQQLSWSLVVRNAVLSLLLLGGLVAPTHGQFDAATLVGMAGSTLCLIVTYFTANQLLANRQRFGAAA